MSMTVVLPPIKITDSVLTITVRDGDVEWVVDDDLSGGVIKGDVFLAGIYAAAAYLTTKKETK